MNRREFLKTLLAGSALVVVPSSVKFIFDLGANKSKYEPILIPVMRRAVPFETAFVVCSPQRVMSAEYTYEFRDIMHIHGLEMETIELPVNLMKFRDDLNIEFLNNTRIFS